MCIMGELKNFAGKPQCGQLSARSDILLLHSGHEINGILCLLHATNISFLRDVQNFARKRKKGALPRVRYLLSPPKGA